MLDYSRRVRVVVDPEPERRYVDEMLMSARVEIFLGDGRKLERQGDTLLGDSGLPQGDTRIRDKFRNLAGYSLKPEQVDQAIALADDLEGVEDINLLTSMF